MTDALAQIRQLMKEKNWDLYVLPRTDEHQSQYIAPCDQRVEFISGFSGSNAITLISQKEALLWTDSRYFLQAEKELKEGWQMRKLLQGQIFWHQHSINEYPGATLGIDPRLITAEASARRIIPIEKAGLKVELSIENLVDLIWKDKPNAQKGQIFIHEQWAGRSTQEKVEWVRNNIKEKGGKSAIFNDLSEVGWILNLRSSDIPFNPFFKGVLIVKLEGGALYLPHDNPSLKNQKIKEYLAKVNLKLEPYEPVFEDHALINKSFLNYYIYSSIKDKNPIEWDSIGIYRAVRTEKECNGFRRSHLVDGIAMAKFWTWRSKLNEIDDLEAAQYMDKLRAQQEHNKGPSFETISGGGPNAAVIHYHATPKNHALITKDMIHLVDSGGQYLDGTTDVTRTFHFGNPSAEIKDSYTRVLLGVIDVERLRMPAGRFHGGDIDILARRHLWAVNKDYGHGTGHGVGYFQGVHEGPVALSKYNTTNYQKGMIVTVEPGYYEAGQYGIRIEDMVLTMEDNGWNYFQVLTLCPYDRNLIDLSLLSNNDIAYLDKYHQRVWNELSPKLQDDKETLEWLKAATAPLQ